MAKTHLKPLTIIIIISIVTFILILGAVFYLTFKVGQKSSLANSQQLIDTSRGNTDNYQQIRRIKFTDQTSGKSTEIFMDGTVNQYDKYGKLIKSGRRGFAETEALFRKFEWLINNNQTFGGGGYQVDIETQKGIITVNPGGGGGGPVDDAIDFIDHTLNPTPTPVPSPSPTGGPTPTPYPDPTPDPSGPPAYESAPPFKCSDYYVSGKPLKISNIICGPAGN